MDFKLTFPNGEPIKNNDLMYMQYSNFYALQALGSGLDAKGEGVTIRGCQLSGTYNIQDDSVSEISVSDGYIAMNGSIIRVEGTVQANQIAFTYFNGYRTPIYVFASELQSYNELGNKIFNDGSPHQTWLQMRISIRSSNYSTPLAGEVLIGSFYVSAPTPGVGVPGEFQINQDIKPFSSAIVNNTEATDITTTHRGGRSDECVTVSNLYEVMGNWNIKQYVSTTYTFQEDNGKAWYVYTIALNDPTITDATVLSAYYTNPEANISYGFITSPQELSWYYNRSTNIIYINFDEFSIGRVVTAQILVKRA